MCCDDSYVLLMLWNHLSFLFLCGGSSNGFLNDKFNHVNLCDLKKKNIIGLWSESSSRT